MIGKSKLVIRRLNPLVELAWSGPTISPDFRFTLQELAQKPTIEFEGVTVTLFAVRASALLMVSMQLPT